jgi:hypothetical protein
MTLTTRAALVATSIFAGAMALSGSASALTADEIFEIYSATAIVESVVPSPTDPSRYEVTLIADGVSYVILVDAETGEVVNPDEPGADEPAATEVAEVENKDACKDYGWVELGFRNQGQCIRLVNTGVDTRPAETEADEGSESGPDRDECKNGGWEALGFRNQGQCIAG